MRDKELIDGLFRQCVDKLIKGDFDFNPTGMRSVSAISMDYFMEVTYHHNAVCITLDNRSPDRIQCTLDGDEALVVPADDPYDLVKKAREISLLQRLGTLMPSKIPDGVKFDYQFTLKSLSKPLTPDVQVLEYSQLQNTKESLKQLAQKRGYFPC